MNITEDGMLTFSPSTSSTVVLVSGNLGPASVAVGYMSGSDSFVAFDGASSAESGKQYMIEHGRNIDLVIKTAGSDILTDVDVMFSVVTL